MRQGLVVVFVIVLACPLPSQAEGPSAIEIRVVDDSSRGVKSKIYLIEPDSKEMFLDDTDPDGLAKPTRVCTSGQRLKAKPANRRYFDSSPEPCSGKNKLQLKVSSRVVVENLQRHAVEFEKLGNGAKAAFLYNELAVRVAGTDSERAAQADKKVYVLTGKALDTKTPAVVFDEFQDKFVMSEGLAVAVRDFQKENGLKATGRLDHPTLKTLSKERINDYIVAERKPREFR